MSSTLTRISWLVLLCVVGWESQAAKVEATKAFDFAVGKYTITPDPPARFRPSGAKIFWTAQPSLRPSSPVVGDSFVICRHRTGEPQEPFIVASDLTETTKTYSGTYDLPDTTNEYSICVNAALMGPGVYTVNYDIAKPTVAVSTSLLDLGSYGAGTPASATKLGTESITVKSEVPIRFVKITPAADAHFVLTTPGVDFVDASASHTFSIEARYNPLTDEGSHSQTFTVDFETIDKIVAAPSVSFTVKGTTTIPDIVCDAASVNFGLVDGDIGKTKSLPVSFHNAGLADLVISKIEVKTDDPPATGPAPFRAGTLPSTAILKPTIHRPVDVLFGPPAGETMWTGFVRIESNDPDTPTLDCKVLGRAHHPPYLAIAKGFQPRVVIPPGPFDSADVHYFVSVRNTGSIAANNSGPEIVDELPSELMLREARARMFSDAPSASDGVVTIIGNRVEWNGEIPPASKLVLSIAADISAPPGTTVSNDASVRYDTDGDGAADTTLSDGVDFVTGGPTIVSEIPLLDARTLALLVVALASLATFVLARRK